jgi:hypothetical protein
MRELAAGVDPARVDDPDRLAAMVAGLDYQVDLFETLAAWRATFLPYHRWLDTGEVAAQDAWRTGLAAFEPRRDAHEARYGGDLDRPAYSFDAVDRGLVHATRTATMAWIARGLLVLLAVGIGLAIAARTRAAPTGAAATGVATTGAAPTGGAAPSRRTELLTVLVTAGWLLLAFLTFSSFASPHYLGLQVLVVGVFAGVVAVLARQGRRGRREQPPTDRGAGPVAALVGISGPLLAVTAVLVAVLSWRGPGYFWLRFWTSTGFRTWFTTVSVALLVWLGYAVIATLRSVTGCRTRAAVGGLLVAAGATIAAVGAVPGVAGLERMLTGLNDELAVLPLGLSRILGITVHLDIPTALPGYLVAGGAVLVLAGLLLRWGGTRTTRPPSHLGAHDGHDDGADPNTPAPPDTGAPPDTFAASGASDTPRIPDDRPMEIDR